MYDRDLISFWQVLIGIIITVISTVMSVMLPEVQFAHVPFLLLPPALLIILSAAQIEFSMSKRPSPL